MIATSLGVFVLLYVTPRRRRLRADASLRPASTRRARPRTRAGRRRPAGAGSELRGALTMTLETVLVLSDRGSLGGLLPARGLRLRRRDAAPVPAAAAAASASGRVMFESIGPVWDGNEVWLVVAGGRDVRRVPGLVRDDVLGLLHRAAARPRPADRAGRLVRVAREEREPALASRRGCGPTRSGSIGAAFIWGVALANLLHGVPLNSSHGFCGRLLRPVQRLHRARRRGRRAACSRSTVRPTSRFGRAAISASEPPLPPGACRCSRRVARHRVRRLDGRRRAQPQQQRRPPDGDPGRGHRRCARSGRSGLVRTRARAAGRSR